MRRDDGSGGDEEEREVRIIPSEKGSSLDRRACHGTAYPGERRAMLPDHVRRLPPHLASSAHAAGRRPCPGERWPPCTTW